MGKDTKELKNKLDHLESIILDTFPVSHPDVTNKEWLDTIIDKFHFPKKYEEKKAPTTLLAIVEEFIKKTPDRKDSNGRSG